MQFPVCLTKPAVGNTFAGVPISQTWQDLALWEIMLNNHACKAIIELGTWRGGMAHFLAIQSKARNINLLTVDLNPIDEKTSKDLQDLNTQVLTLSIFTDDGKEAIKNNIQTLPKPLLLFCDNGNKPAEFATFAPLLSQGDYAVVHDWETEFHERDLTQNVEMILKTESESIQSMTRFFKVI